IVKIYKGGEYHGNPYYAMELIGGQTLADHIRAKVWSPKEAAALVAKLAQAIDHAHFRGVIHRDLKPKNILIDANGEPHVIDLGVAKCVDHSAVTSINDLVGTPNYMAP